MVNRMLRGVTFSAYGSTLSLAKLKNSLRTSAFFCNYLFSVVLFKFFGALRKFSCAAGKFCGKAAKL